MAIPLEPALVRFVANPWARVRVGDQVDLLTPQAAPVELAPGEYVVTFEHPAYGRVEYEVEVVEGEARVVRHDFRQEDAS